MGKDMNKYFTWEIKTKMSPCTSGDAWHLSSAVVEVQVETRIRRCGTRRGMLLRHAETEWFRCPGCESPLPDCVFSLYKAATTFPFILEQAEPVFRHKTDNEAVLCQHHSFLFVGFLFFEMRAEWGVGEPIARLGVLGSKVCTIKSCLPALLLNVLKPKTTQLPVAGRKWPSSYVSLHSGTPLRNEKERTPWAHLCRWTLVN